jgi:hypothetical protein
MPEFSPKLTPSAVAVFVVLMTEPEALTNADLGARLCVQKPDSAALGVLRRNGLLREGRVGRLTTYTLSDIGWDRSPEVMGTAPKGKGSAAGALLALLKGLKGGFDATGVSPREFFTRPAAPAPNADVEALIRKAYHDLTKVAGDWVSLADIRDRLGSREGGQVDVALLALARSDPSVKLIRWDDQKVLTDRERAAAVRYGAADAHALRIESP